MFLSIPSTASQSPAHTEHSSKALGAAPSFPRAPGREAQPSPGSGRSREVTKPSYLSPAPGGDGAIRGATQERHNMMPCPGRGQRARLQLGSIQGLKINPPLPPRCHLRCHSHRPQRAGPYIELVRDMPRWQPMCDRAMATSGDTGTAAGVTPRGGEGDRPWSCQPLAQLGDSECPASHRATSLPQPPSPG